MMKNIFAFLLLLGAVACTSDVQIQEETKAPANIIFLIGDGMGLSALGILRDFGG